MKLFKLTVGLIEKYGVAESEQDMYERRTEVDYSFDYLPVIVEEIVVDGYDIVANPLALAGEDKPKRGRPREQ